jgi:hypothetical protein
MVYISELFWGIFLGVSFLIIELHPTTAKQHSSGNIADNLFPISIGPQSIGRIIKAKEPEASKRFTVIFTAPNGKYHFAPVHGPWISPWRRDEWRASAIVCCFEPFPKRRGEAWIVG